MAANLALLQPTSSARLSLSRSCGRARCTLATPVAAVQSSESATLAPQQRHTPEAAWAPIIAGASSLLVASSAWGEEVEDVIIESTGDEAQALNDVLAAVQQEQSSYDLFVSIMFTGVVGSLAVVTLGIAYLSLRQWLDQRQEEEDKQAALNPKKVFENVDKIKPEEKDMDDAMALSLKKSFQAKRDKTKGFGGNVTTTPKEF